MKCAIRRSGRRDEKIGLKLVFPSSSQNICKRRARENNWQGDGDMLLSLR